MRHECTLANLTHKCSVCCKQVPVRTMVFVAIPPREEPWTGSPEPAQLQEYAWNHFQRLSWAIANNLEVSR